MSLNDLEIRKALVADAEAISGTIVQAVRETNAADYSPEIVDRVVKNFSPDKVRLLLLDREVFVALLNGQAVGTASLKGEDVRSVFVSPDHQARGIGTTLIRRIEKHAITNGMSILRVPSSTTGEEFYRKLGFTVVRDEWCDGERTIVIEKAIASRKERAC